MDCQLIKLTAADKDVFNADEILFRHSFYHRSVINLADAKRLQKLKAPDTRNLRKGIRSILVACTLRNCCLLFNAGSYQNQQKFTHALVTGFGPEISAEREKLISPFERF